MELTYECPACGAVGTVPDVARAETVACRCGRARPLHPQALEEGGALAACPWCATEDLYVQKDFPHGLGLAIVLAGFAVSTAFWYAYRPIAALAALLVTAALDLVLYYLVPDVTICYRCLGQCRGPGSNPGGRFLPFDLALGERYRQERLRVEELRQRRGTAGTAPPG
ncbi:MAG TPA: hypothetical protein VF590_01780 [Isosphaeraceae bacterium]|jgi:hypothetical protein